MASEPKITETADVVLKIAALVGLAAAVLSFGYNHYVCTKESWQVVFSVPVLLLALLIFGLALGLSDKAFGSFRELEIWSGPIHTRLFRFFLYLIGYFSEVSFGVVATYTFLAAGNVPNCFG